MGNDVNLQVKTTDDKDAELQRLREENARLQQKRENDERSAFGRLEKEAELRKQRERELEEMRRRIAELEAANLERVLPPEQLEALGTDGVRGVRTIIEKSLPQPAPAPSGGDKLTEMEQRLANIEAMQRAEAERRAYSAAVTAHAASLGVGSILPRLAPGGDLGERWRNFVASQAGLQQSLDTFNVGETNRALELFLFQNPDIATPAPTPSQAAASAQAVAPPYGMAEWLADTAKLDADRKEGRITVDQCAKGYAEATAKLNAAMRR